ncbi:MAG: hypothetical protein ACFNVH_05775, partial [Segatella maculosa]
SSRISRVGFASLFYPKRVFVPNSRAIWLEIPRNKTDIATPSYGCKKRAAWNYPLCMIISELKTLPL